MSERYVVAEPTDGRGRGRRRRRRRTRRPRLAESRIRDVDMAKQMMEFTKFNILNQAATAMLAQANQLPQNVLQLLK